MKGKKINNKKNGKRRGLTEETNQAKSLMLVLLYACVFFCREIHSESSTPNLIKISL